jgi:hypothetical protein
MGGIHAQREVAHPALSHALPNDAPGVLDRYPTLRPLEEDHHPDHEDDEGHQEDGAQQGDLLRPQHLDELP